MEVERTCIVCGETKPIGEFWRNGPRERDLRRRQCNVCCLKRRREATDERLELPIAPFRSFLKRRLRHYDSEKALASALGTAPRTLYRWLHDGQTVQLDVVDRALVSEGSALLVELYPLDDEQAA